MEVIAPLQTGTVFRRQDLWAVEHDVDPRILIPLAFGLLAGFLFLRLLAHAHLFDRALLDLFRRAVTLREKQEDLERRIGTAPLLSRTRRFEEGIREILVREGIRPPA